MAEFRFTGQKYSEAEFLFQTIEMAKSDEEYDAELCTTPPAFADCDELVCLDPKMNSGKLKERKHRQCFHRRYTFSNGSPPAPPSTPTSLTTNCSTPLSSPTANTGLGVERLHSSQLFIVEDPPKLSSRYLKKLQEHHRTDAELSKLFNVVTITGKNARTNEPKRCNSPERGISSTSRTIRKQNMCAKVFKIHRNPKEFFREPDDDSVSAPEYDTQEERRFARYKHSKRHLQNRRQRRFARFQHQERMEAMLDIFDTTMNINDA